MDGGHALSSLGKLKPFQVLIELAIAVVIVLLLYLAYRKAWVGWIALPLAAWAGVLILRPDQPDVKRLALFWVGTALMITIVVELFTVRGDIGRMNTIFKFYLQAWTLLAVSGGAAFVWILADLHAWLPRWRNLWQTGLLILFAGAALYTVAATTDKVSDRMAPQAPHTLNSMTYMKYAEFWDTQTMDLEPGLPRHPLDAEKRPGLAGHCRGQLSRVPLVHALHDLYRPARSGRLELAPAPTARPRSADAWSPTASTRSDSSTTPRTSAKRRISSSNMTCATS